MINLSDETSGGIHSKLEIWEKHQNLKALWWRSGMLICKSRRLDNDLMNVKSRTTEYQEKTSANEDYFEEEGELEDDNE